MIGVDKQYLFIFDIAGNSDFIETDDQLNFFIIKERAGNLLPEFEFEFLLTAKYDKVLRSCNEGNILNVSFGKEVDGLSTCKFRILKKNISRVGHSYYKVYLTGVHDSVLYNTKNKIESYDKKSAVEVIQEIVSKYYTPDFNKGSSEDKQYWLQPNIPDKKMVNNLWCHAYTSNSFWATAITVASEFRCYDMQLETSEKWRFGYQEGLINISGDYNIIDSSGFLNAWQGYGKNRTVYDLINVEYPDTEEEFQPFLAQSPTFNRNADVPEKVSQFQLLNDNVDSKYWKAYKRQLTSSALFSSMGVRFSYYNRYEDMKALDVAMLLDDRPDVNRSVAEEQSGKYFITEIERVLSKKQFVTKIALNRGAMNMNRGGLR